MSVEARKPVVIEHNLKTTDVQVKVYNEDGQQIRGVMKVLDENRLSFESRTPIEKARVEVTGKRKIENSMFYKASQYAARTAMMVKNFSVTYTGSDGTYLPGFMPEPSIFGSGHYTPDATTFGNIASSTAPGIGFLMGWQDSVITSYSIHYTKLYEIFLQLVIIISAIDSTFRLINTSSSLR